MNKNVFYIGGSPCSGKSTIAEILSKEYNAYYFKADDYLEELVALAAADKPICRKAISLSSNELWMRDPVKQCAEEFAIYQEISDFLFKKLDNIEKSMIITEAAAYTPSVMKPRGETNYLCIIPTPQFQIKYYSLRDWVPCILEECDDKIKAFDNWMERDILFADQVKKECELYNIPIWITEESKSIDDACNWVKQVFSL